MDKIKAAKFDTMNYDELETFEEIVGSIPTTEEDMEKVPKSKLMIALGFISARRDNPAVTIEEVKALPIGAIVFDDEEDAEGNDEEKSESEDS